MSDVDDFLAHYGRKGMKWGVVNDEEPSTAALGKSLDKALSGSSSGQLDSQAKAKHKARKDFPHKQEVDGSDPKLSDVKQGRLSRNQKIALGIGATVAVAGLAYYGNKHLNGDKGIFLPDGAKKSGSKADRDALESELDGLFGKSKKPVNDSLKESGYYMGMKTKNALNRPEFTIPKGTSFQRLANFAETGEGYSSGTYATFLKNDNNLYGSSRDFKDKLHTVNFDSSKEVRVPSTKQVMAALKQSIKDNGDPASNDIVAQEYKRLAGSDWRTTNGSRTIARLKSQGYSAIVDDQDAGHLGDLPILFFGNASNVTSKPRKPSDILDNEKNAISPSQRYV